MAHLVRALSAVREGTRWEGNQRRLGLVLFLWSDRVLFRAQRRYYTGDTVKIVLYKERKLSHGSDPALLRPALIGTRSTQTALTSE